MTTHPPRRTTVLLAAAVLLLGGIVSACGDDDDLQTSTGDDPTSDDGAAPAPDWDDEDFPAEAARDRARAQLGMAEEDLEPDVRVRRRGDEQFMLTEDYVLGRITVELDDDGSGTYVVTEATVELPDGPETFRDGG